MTSPWLKAIRVLVVEDEAAAREALVDLLIAEGFELAVARDGSEALEVAKAFGADLVLMDFGLPSVNGWEATLRLRRDPATAHVPVLAVTGQGNPEALRLAHEVGCVDVVLKPFDPRQLAERLRALAASPPAADALPGIPGEGC
jgi:CheY-like chemotaxis protein